LILTELTAARSVGCYSRQRANSPLRE